ALYDDEHNGMRTTDGRVYTCNTLCDLIHAEGAEILATYTDDFYAGMPCVTVNHYGAGRAYYIATCPDADYLDRFYGDVVPGAGIIPEVRNLPMGVQATRRGDIAFILNFSGTAAEVALPQGFDLLTGEATGGIAALPVNGYRIIRLKSEGADAQNE
ncbi:MAG: beta-galactosidase trimerization domain-containing protein, partial [Eubacteriales bacterium]